ncbi:MAG: phage portal protein [Pikeienuella sp.]
MKLPSFLRKTLSPPGDRGNWYTIFESDTGAWQQNVTVNRDGVMANPFVFTCQTLIARDIAKLRVMLMEEDGSISKEVRNRSISPLLRKPNIFQSRNQFWEHWILSKLSHGNTYVLKRRNRAGAVEGLYVLDPSRVTPLVSDSGEVYYRLNADNISQIREDITVPAREIIHDRWNTLFHPLVGLSPIFANGVTATQGLSIQDTSTKFFINQARPGGILSAPGKISDDTAARLKAAFDANYSGNNAGKIAVAGDGLAFTPLSITATDAQLVEQLKMSAETVASTYHIPLYKVGLGAMPTAGNTQTLNLEYYAQALQGLIEDAESCLDDGLELPNSLSTRFDVENLWRMDSLTQAQVLKEYVGAGLMAPNEGRARINLGPKPGGDSPYMQEQNYSLEALAKRDAKEDPWGADAPAHEPPVIENNEAEERAFVAETLLSMRKAMEAA